MAGFLRLIRVAAVATVVGVMVMSPSPAEAVGGEGEGWPAFGESDGCGSPWIRGPKVEFSGALPASTMLRGPQAAYFGRTVGQIWDSLKWWDVPMSNGESLRLHERIFPALSSVDSSLAQAASDGLNYSIEARYTYGYTARTIGGRTRVSQHSFGNALDINSTTNPYTEGAIRTDMPSWFVDSFRDAGFCWGGDWIEVKDPMHYNWRGPVFTPGVDQLPASYAPLTATESFSREMYDVNVPGPLESTDFRLLMEADNDGAVDIVNVSRVGSQSVVDVVRSATGYQSCGVSRYPTSKTVNGSVAIPGDWNRDGAQDIWVIDDTDGVEIEAILRYGDFTETETASVPTEPADAYVAADHNVDGWSDLYLLRHDGTHWAVEVRSGADRFASVLATGTFPGSESLRFTAVDRDIDHVPDLMGIGETGSLIVDGASSFDAVEAISVSESGYVDIAGSDFDGDGRHDLVILDGVNMRVLAGNTRLAGLQVTSWFNYPQYSCSAPALPYPYIGAFRDDDSSVHQADIDAIAETDITKGCNPPLNDQFCSERTITRGELAAFIRRALDLPTNATNTYVDDDGSEFEQDIEALVGAGMVFSCGSEGDSFCPDREVTREVMAKFLTVAFDLEPSPVDAFADDDESMFEADIDAIAALGITKGCNPPQNDMFCPERIVSRQEMASFIIRALRTLDP